MIRVRAQLESISPYSPSRYHDTPKLPKESAEDYETRTWMQRCHTNDDGNVVIPPMCFKKTLEEAAKYLGLRIPGKGMATWSKHFEAGIMCIEPLVLPVTKDSVEGERLFLNADGKKGGGKRVARTMPKIANWSGSVEFIVLDHTITQEAFTEHLQQAGQFIGIGRWRPRNGGAYGRFLVKSVKWNV